MPKTHMQKPLEGLLRPPIEWYSSLFAVGGIALFQVFPSLFWIPQDLLMPMCGALGALALWRSYQGYSICSYQRNLKSMPSYKLSANQLPIKPGKLFLGKGFAWESIHTQRLRDLDLPYNQHYIAKESSGHPHIHGVSLHEKEIYIDLGDRASHVVVLGLPGMGKTRFAESLIAQDIRRGDVVIILDPKGDKDLLQRIIAEAKLVGRSNQLRIMHLGFPKTSCRYNPISFFTKLSQVATRITNALPSTGEAAAFKEFAWKYVNLVARALIVLGLTPTYRLINFYLTKLDVLFGEVMQDLFKQDTELQQQYDQYHQKQPSDKAINPTQLLLGFAEAYIKHLGHAKVQHDSALTLISDLIAACRLDRTYYDKITASVGPLLEKLTSGEIADLLSPDYENLDDERPILDLLQAIREKQIIYVGMDALTDPVIASAVGNAMLSDLTAIAGHLYKFGLSDDLPNHLPQEVSPKIYLHVDEFNEVIGNEFIPLLNKARGAGFSASVYTQTWADVEARLASTAKASQTAGNLGTLIMFRCKGSQTLEMLLNDLPKVPVLRMTPASSSSDNPHGTDGVYFQSSNEDRLSYQDMPLIDQNDVVNLAKGEAFALLQGGKLYKLRMPLPIHNELDISLDALMHQVTQMLHSQV